MPTMGNLHEGHLALVQQAKAQAKLVVVSIFVNPSQFAPGEDLDRYPRTLEADLAHLQPLNIAAVFAPSIAELYPSGVTASLTHVNVPHVATGLCARSRPHFFCGVATIVTKLLNIFRPNVAIFGEKDFQQLQVVKALCRDLLIPTYIHGVPTLRETTGLALSSRNQYLSPEQTLVASKLFTILTQTQQDILAHTEQQRLGTYLASLCEHAQMALVEFGFRMDYFEILDANNLQPVSFESTDVLIAVAAWLGETRLIDNVHFQLSPVQASPSQH